MTTAITDLTSKFDRTTAGIPKIMPTPALPMELALNTAIVLCYQDEDTGEIKVEGYKYTGPADHLEDHVDCYTTSRYLIWATAYVSGRPSYGIIGRAPL